MTNIQCAIAHLCFFAQISLFRSICHTFATIICYNTAMPSIKGETMIQTRKIIIFAFVVLFGLMLSACSGDPVGGTDTTKPVITLKGSATVSLHVGDTYSDAGATATDDTDGNITDKIVVHNPVNTAVAGTYTVTYDVNDTAGNAADQVKRTVTVTVVTPNQLPIANAGVDLADYPSNPITLNGSGSSDPDGTIVSYTWKEGSTVLSTSESFVKSDFAFGEHTITLTVTDNDGATASDTLTVTIYKTLKRTNQDTIYDADGTAHTSTEAENNASLRDDGYYQKGTAYNSTRDNATEIVTDHITGLQWQDDTNATALHENWATADTFCSNLTLGGFTDWRLPTVDELMYIDDHNATIESPFAHVISSNYWSSTPYVSDNTKSWYVRFGYGYAAKTSKTNSCYIRCVRGETADRPSYVRDSMTGIVTDRYTGLQWQDDYSDNGGNVKTTSWTDAIDYCEALTLDGYNDWRLPNFNELFYLADRGRENSAIDAVFQNTINDHYWSSTTLKVTKVNALEVNFSDGYSYYSSKTSLRGVRCVRSGE